MPISSLLTTNTFRDWFLKTNEIILKLNTGTVVDSTVANGAFVVNGSLQVVNTFLANVSTVLVSGNTIVAANTVASANCNVWNFACGSLLIQPINGTVVNTAITVNAAATFLNVISANGNVSLTADMTQTGNALINGTFTSNNGPVVVRQVVYASSNALVIPAHLTNPQYDDYGPTGLNEAQILNVTPDIDSVITGIVAPTNFSVGGRILYIQNLSTTFKVTLASANTSSQVNNRFKTLNDTPLDIGPGAAVAVLYTTTNHQWRPLSPVIGVVPALTVTGNLSVTGTSSLGNTTINGWLNCASTLQVAGISTQGRIDSGNTSITGTLQTFGVSTFSANVILNGTRSFANGQLRCDTTNGRLVLPVGTNLWAT